MTTLARLLFPEYFGKGFLFPHTTSSIPHILDAGGDNKKLEHNCKAWTPAHRQRGDGCCVQTWHTPVTLAGHQPPQHDLCAPQLPHHSPPEPLV